MNQNNAEGNQFNKWKMLGIFAGEEYLIYVHKKTERIVSALYLVTDFLKDSEPMKWEIREKGVSLLSSSFSLNTSDSVDKNVAAQTIFATSIELISYLKMCVLSEMLSRMNFSVLERELNNIVSVLYDRMREEKKQHGYILSQAFFDTTGAFENTSNQTEAHASVSDGSIKTTKDTAHAKDFLGKKMSNNTVSYSSNPFVNNGISKKTSEVGGQIKKDERVMAILDLAGRQSGLTIKDFKKVITSCSEKTIQRELLDLVEKGVLKKEGERRWSKYSLNR